MSWVLDSAFSIHNTSASLMYDKYLYVANEDFDIRVWNTEESTLFRKLPPDRSKQSGHTAQITGFAYSSRYDLLFSCSFDGSIITWHGTTMVHKFQYAKATRSRFPTPIYSIYFNEENEILVIGLNGEVVTFELSPTIMSQLVANGDTCPFSIRQVARIHNDIVSKITGFQRRLFTCSYDRTINSTQLMDLTSTKVISRLPTTPSVLIGDLNTQSVIVGDLTGTVKNYSVEGLYLGTLAEDINQGIQCVFIDQAMQLVWIAGKDGSIHVIDPKHANQDIADNFQMFKDLPVAGSSKPSFEQIMGNGLTTRISAIVNHRYVYTWKWESSAYLFRINLKGLNMKTFTTFTYEDDNKDLKRIKHKKNGTSTLPSGSISRRGEFTGRHTPLEDKKVNSSLVAFGTNVFVGGNTIVSLRPATNFLYQNDTLLEKAESTCMDFCYPELCLFIGFKNGTVMSVCFSMIRNLVGVHEEGVKVTSVYAIGSCCVSIVEDSKSMILWDAHDQFEQVCKRERVHDNTLTASCALPGAKEVYTCDSKGFMRSWLISPTEMKEQMLIDHSQFGGINFCITSQMEDMIICSSEDGYIRGWQRSNILGSASFVFSVSPCYITALSGTAFNDLLVATDDKTIRLISLQTREEKAIFVGHSDLITNIIVPPKGDRWISMQWNGELFFWSHIKATKSGRISATPKDLYSQSTTARLPKLTPSRPSEKTERAQSQFSVQPNDQMISMYEKNRKALLIKRRDEERAARAERRTPQYHKILQLTSLVQKIMNDYDSELKKNHDRN